MTSLYHRARPEPLVQSVKRCCRWMAIVAALAGLWWLARPAIVYQLACASLRVYHAPHLVARAIVERHPSIDLPPPHANDFVFYYGGRVYPFRNGRRRGAMIRTGPIQYPSWGQSSMNWMLFDDRLDILGSLRVSNLAGLPTPDDRDGDGAVEVVAMLSLYPPSTTTAPATGPARYAHVVVSLGSERHSLIAVVERAPAGPLAAPPMFFPNWTNTDNDARHELALHELVSSTSAPAAPGATTYSIQTAFRLKWLRPGVMFADPPPPAGDRIWLAKTPNEVTFDPDEAVEDVVERVMNAGGQ